MTRRQLSVLERRDWLRLARSENVGPITFIQLLRQFGSVPEALNALPELSGRGGLNRPIRLYSNEDADAELARVYDLGARYIASCEPDYPARLRHIDDPPPLVCVRGDAALADGPVLGLVGSRKASAVGLKLARSMAAKLGAAGLVIASGLARGIDTAAHEAAIGTGTIAVIASGIDVVYPPENRDLQNSIGETGLVLTEVPPGSEPRAKHFPRRNRLIAGISLGVLVIEAARRSGSLITARKALEQGREVFAVPGSPLDPRAAGTNRLIQNGAHLVSSADSVLDVLLPLIEQTRRPLSYGPDPFSELNEDEMPGPADVSADARARLVSLLSPSPVGIDDLIRESGLTPGEVHLVLIELELAGRLIRHAGQSVSLDHQSLSS